LAGCGLDISVILGLMKFIGIIAIVCGLALTFAGSKFIPMVIGFLIGTGIFLTCFVIGAIVITGTGAAIGLSVVGLILGGVAGYFSGKFVEDYGIQMIAFAAGGIIVFILASTIPSIPGAAKIGCAIAAGALGWFLAGMMKDYVASFGTAIIGSGLFVLGLDQYLPGLPDVFPKNGAQLTSLGPAAFGYIAGFVVLICLGAFV